MFSCFRLVLCAIALAAIGLVVTSMSASAADFYHNGRSLNHLGITGQSVNYNSELVRRDMTRQNRDINAVNRTQVDGGGIQVYRDGTRVYRGRICATIN